MATYCENCGSIMDIHGCTYCNEELYILDQYDELEMDYPDEDSVFMQRVREIESGENK